MRMGGFLVGRRLPASAGDPRGLVAPGVVGDAQLSRPFIHRKPALHRRFIRLG